MAEFPTSMQFDELEAALADERLWNAPWTAHTFEIDCPCPNGEHCGDSHSCEEIEALEAYPRGAPGEPAEEGEGQCVVQISVPGLETFAAPTAKAICLLRNLGPALLAAARDRDRMKLELDVLRTAFWCAACHGSGLERFDGVDGLPVRARCHVCAGSGRNNKKTSYADPPSPSDPQTAQARQSGATTGSSPAAGLRAGTDTCGVCGGTGEEKVDESSNYVLYRCWQCGGSGRLPRKGIEDVYKR